MNNIVAIQGGKKDASCELLQKLRKVHTLILDAALILEELPETYLCANLENILASLDLPLDSLGGILQLMTHVEEHKHD